MFFLPEFDDNSQIFQVYTHAMILLKYLAKKFKLARTLN